MRDSFSLHDNYSDNEPNEAGSDRAFGCTVGGILMAIGALKIVTAGTPRLTPCLIVAVGAALLLLGIVAPRRLSSLNQLWLKFGGVIAKVVNPIVLALLFFLVLTPMAIILRMAGKRPLRLVRDRGAVSYWIAREPSADRAPDMRRQF